MDTSEKQIKRIVLNRMERCGVCHHVFAPEDIQVLSRRADMWLMVVSCTECHARNFVAAVLGDGDPSEAQLPLRSLGRQHADGPGEPPEPIDADASPETPAHVLDEHLVLRDRDAASQRRLRSW